MRLRPFVFGILALAAATPAHAGFRSSDPESERASGGSKRSAERERELDRKPFRKEQSKRYESSAPGPSSMRWLIGKGKPQNTLIFFHGLGDKPDSYLANELVRGLASKGLSLEVIAPFAKPLAMTKGRSESSFSWASDWFSSDRSYRDDYDSEWSRKPRLEIGSQSRQSQIEAARQILNTRPGKVFVGGFSLGGGGALAVADAFPDRIHGTIAIAPAIGMVSIGGSSKLSTPTLLIHGIADNMVPFRGSNRLFKANRDQVKFVKVPHVGHDLQPHENVLPMLANEMSQFIDALGDAPKP